MDADPGVGGEVEEDLRAVAGEPVDLLGVHPQHAAAYDTSDPGGPVAARS